MLLCFTGVAIAKALLLWVDFSSYCFVMCIYTTLDSSFLLLSQTYEKVASAFKLEEDVIVANLDADQHKDLAEK